MNYLCAHQNHTNSVPHVHPAHEMAIDLLTDSSGHIASANS
jgi:hypothetical protein